MKRRVKEIEDKIRNILAKTWFDKAVVVFIVAIGILWFSVTFQKYQQYAFTTGDTAVAEQAIWNTTHGRIFYQSFLQTDTNLREHLNIIQFLYVPFYAVYPHTLTLFFVIQLSLVAGMIYLYFYVKKKLGKIAAILAVGLFMFNPLTASQAVGDMHVVTIVAPIFLMLLISYHEKRYKSFVFWTVAMVLVSEFVAPTVALVGFLALIDRRGWQWVLPPVLGGIGLQLAAKYYITIGFGSSEYILSKFKPAALANIYKMNTRLELLYKALAPMLWIFPWFSKYSILLIPSLLIALVIIIPGRIAGGSHVFLPIVPVLVMVFIDLLERFKSYRKWIYVIAMMGIILSSYRWYKWMEIDGSDFTVQMNHALKAVKDGGSLTSSSAFGSKLNRREEFFLPMNDKMTDYVVLKLGKNREKQSDLEDQADKYDQKIANSGLYRLVFKEDRVIVFVKKEKIAEIAKIPVSEIDAMSDEELQGIWKKTKTK